MRSWYPSRVTAGGRVALQPRGRQGELDRHQALDLVLVHRNPVVLEDAGRVAGVGVPRQPRPVDALSPGRGAAGVSQVGGDLLIPLLVGGVGRLELAAEFANPDRGNIPAEEVTPELVPDGRQVVGVVRGVEPRLV